MATNRTTARKDESNSAGDRSRQANANTATTGAKNAATGQQAREAAETRSDREREMSAARESGTGVTQRRQGGSALSSVFDVGDPFTTMQQMMSDMDRLMSAFGMPTAGLSNTLGRPARSQMPSRVSQGAGTRTLWAPQVEVFQRDNNLVVRADLPGLKKDDVDVHIENDALVIQGERRNEFEDRQEGYYRSERSYGSFYRAIPLPEGTSPDQVNARFQDGVLEITAPLPTQEQRKGKKIEVK